MMMSQKVMALVAMAFSGASAAGGGDVVALSTGGLHDCFRCIISIDDVDSDDGHYEVEFTCNTGKDIPEHKDSTYQIELGTEFLVEWGTEISIHPMPFCVHGGVLNVKKGRIEMPPGSTIDPIYDEESRRLRRLREEPKVGKRTVLAVRVFSDDAQPVMTRDDVRAHIFSEGPVAHPDSLATQFEVCSGGALDMVAITGIKGVENGVFDLNYGKEGIKGKDIAGDMSFRNQLSDDLHDRLGIEALNDKIDHVL